MPGNSIELVHVAGKQGPARRGGRARRPWSMVGIGRIWARLRGRPNRGDPAVLPERARSTLVMSGERRSAGVPPAQPCPGAIDEAPRRSGRAERTCGRGAHVHAPVAARQFRRPGRRERAARGERAASSISRFRPGGR